LIAVWGWPILVTAVGYTVLGLTGFRSALIVVSLRSWRWPLPEVVALTPVPGLAAGAAADWRW
jgi:hypothetical protein